MDDGFMLGMIGTGLSGSSPRAALPAPKSSVGNFDCDREQREKLVFVGPLYHPEERDAGLDRKGLAPGVPGAAIFGQPRPPLWAALGIGLCCLKLLHAFSEGPERTINADILVDAVDWAGLAPNDPAIFRLTGAIEATPDNVFLNGVEGGPEVDADISGAARPKDLLGRDRAIFLAIAGDKAGLGEHALFLAAEGKRGHVL